MWLSTDPALGEYIPGLDKDKNKNLPGMGGLFNQINANLFHAFGNNPIKYVDPDGRVTRHTDLNGTERIKAELKDIIEVSFRAGVYGSVDVSINKFFSISIDIDIGSTSTTNRASELESNDSAGISIDLSFLDFLSAGIGFSKSTDDVSNDNVFFDVIKNAWTNGTFEFDAHAGIGENIVTTSSTSEPDKKIGFELGLGIGGSFWINLSEIKDLFDYLF